MGNSDLRFITDAEGMWFGNPGSPATDQEWAAHKKRLKKEDAERAATTADNIAKLAQENAEAQQAQTEGNWAEAAVNDALAQAIERRAVVITDPEQKRVNQFGYERVAGGYARVKPGGLRSALPQQETKPEIDTGLDFDPMNIPEFVSQEEIDSYQDDDERY